MRFGNVKNALGTVTINKNWCKGCGFCIQYCPTKVLGASPEYNKKGYNPPVVIDAAACRNCGYCQVICPEFAIFVKDAEAPDGPKSAPSSSAQRETHSVE